MRMDIVFDTDILSTFAKTDSIRLIEKLYSKDNLYITPIVLEELKVPKELGYDFPDLVLNSDRFRVLTLNDTEVEEFKTELSKEGKLHKGEIEAMTICKNRGFIFSSKDSKAMESAKSRDIKIITLHSILRALWYFNVLSKQEVRKLIASMEEKDNLNIKNKELVFTED